jgi:23S rRNA (cytidine1920-2'-O)/16S rRNA (cytidine1409-2'-O)-methyltransferase
MARQNRRRLVRLADRVEVGSLDQAVALIIAGRVMVNGMVVTNPDSLVPADAAVTLVKSRTLRGTFKLRKALARFDVTVSGRVCLDVGAAAGGFTTALLHAGARRVYAVDVGHGQLASWLRQDPRVVNLESVNLADLGPDLVPEPVALVCLDLSYLAIADALPQLTRVDLAEDAQLIALVKPTFELRAPSLVKDDEAINKAVATAVAAAQHFGWSVGRTVAPVVGAGGAREVFIYGVRREGRSGDGTARHPPP